MHVQIYSTISTEYVRSMPARSTRCSISLQFPPTPTHLTHPLQALPRPYTSDGAALRQRAVRLPRLRRDAHPLTLTSTLSRCDFRDCEGMRYSLIDMINLARTRLILGSGTAAAP